MKPAVAAAVAELAGPAVAVESWRSVAGGSINAAWWVELSNGEQRFVKTHRDAPAEMFEREAEGLAALAAFGVLRVPRGAVAGRAGGESFLAMEAIAGCCRGPGFFVDFGRRLAELHRRSTGERYGFAHDNYIGATPQPNPWTRSWVEFFRRYRLGHQLELAGKRGRADGELSRLGERLLDRLEDWLDVPGEPPCLLHGDLWSGNFMVGPQGEPVLIDPACYYGHREAELAMTELFGGFEPEFYAAYEETWPLPPESAPRVALYKLYHLLNHLNLFGGSYRAQCVELMKRLV